MAVPSNPSPLLSAERSRLPRLTFWAFIALSLAALPLALPVWNAFLRGTAGRFVTAEQFHLVQYGILGLLGCWVASAEERRRGVTAEKCRWSAAVEGPQRANLAALLGIIALAGLADETIQALLPQRYFQWSDARLNWAGGLAGFSAGWCARGIARWTLRWAARSRAP